MAIDFSKFDEQVNTDELKKNIEEAEKNGGGYRKVPDGVYHGKFEKLEIGETKDGRPMLKAQFRITEGDYAKSCLFMNRVLYGTTNDANMIASAVGWLKTLGAVDDIGDEIEVKFESYRQFNDLVMDIMENIDGYEEYQVAYDENAFNSISIEEVFDV